MRALGTRLSIPLALALAAGCVLAPVDPRGRACPCGPGWACASGICVPERELDGGASPEDAGPRPDAAPTDAAPPDDGGALDAGPPDAGGAPDAGPPDAGPPDPTHCDDRYAGAIHCDGFEFDYPASRGAWGWDLVTSGSGSLATVSDPRPRLGTRALRARIDAMGSRAAIGVNFSPAIVDGELWLRGWFYFPSALAIDDGLSLLYVGSRDGSEGISFQTYGGGQAALWIGTISDWRGTTHVLRRDAWTCLTVHVVLAEPNGAIELFVDGTSIARYEGVDTVPLAAGGFAAVEAGIEYSGRAQSPGTLYVDEVVLSRTFVDCD